MTDIAAIAPPAVTLADLALQRILRAYAPMCHRLASSHEADTLGLTPNAVSIRGLRAREMLRASLENAMPENCDER